MKLEKKIAVITGAGRGIGESIAHTFAAEGADLILAARTRQQLDRVADDIKAKNGNAGVITCDVSSPAEVDNLAAGVKEKFGKRSP